MRSVEVFSKFVLYFSSEGGRELLDLQQRQFGQTILSEVF